MCKKWEAVRFWATGDSGKRFILYHELFVRTGKWWETKTVFLGNQKG